MSFPGISDTQSPPISGVIALERRPHAAKLPLALPAPARTASGSSAQWSTAIAGAFAQLGLSAPPSGNPANALSYGSAGIAQRNNTPQQKAQQYSDVAATVSSFAQVLSASVQSATAASKRTGNLAAVFQQLWTSVGNSAGAVAGYDSDEMPSLPEFLQSLAQQVGESGITGLRGIFVDTQA